MHWASRKMAKRFPNYRQVCLEFDWCRHPGTISLCPFKSEGQWGIWNLQYFWPCQWKSTAATEGNLGRARVSVQVSCMCSIPLATLMFTLTESVPPGIKSNVVLFCSQQQQWMQTNSLDTDSPKKYAAPDWPLQLRSCCQNPTQNSQRRGWNIQNEERQTA